VGPMIEDGNDLVSSPHISRLSDMGGKGAEEHGEAQWQGLNLNRCHTGGGGGCYHGEVRHHHSSAGKASAKASAQTTEARLAACVQKGQESM
jgi:hypothetical protein